MKPIKIILFSSFITLLFSTNFLYAQNKFKIKKFNINKSNVRKSKLDLIKANPNYRIISKNELHNNSISTITEEKHKKLNAIEALKKEFSR